MIGWNVDGGVGTITIERPEVKNAIGPEEWSALAECVSRAANDADVRVVVVRGAGGTFSSGGDLKTMPERLALDREVRRQRLLADGEVISMLRELKKPVVACIEGACVGAGLSLALACDVRIAADDAKLGAGFHRVGLTGDFGMLWMLPRIVGPTRAMDLLMSAEIIDARRAEAIGLVSRVVPREKIVDETAAYVRRLAAGPPVAMGFTKRGILRSLEASFEEMLDWEADAQATCSKTEDALEGVMAFLEKRSPFFKGR